MNDDYGVTSKTDALCWAVVWVVILVCIGFAFAHILVWMQGVG